MLEDKRHTLRSLLSMVTLGLSQGGASGRHLQLGAPEGAPLQTDRMTGREAEPLLNFVAAGGKANDRAAGMANLNLIHKLIANTTIGASGVNRGGPRIYFPPGNYHFSGPIRLRKACYLMGSSIGTRAGYNTIFTFPADTQGIILDNEDTDNLSSQAPRTFTAAGTTIYGIMFQGSATSRSDAHGVLVRCVAVLDNVEVRGFGGHGIYILADFGNPRSGGQASNCLLIGCGGWENAGSGLVIEGGDANVIQVVGGDFTGNGDWGICDLSFLGCTFTGVHAMQNAQPNSGFRGSTQHHIVRHNGKNWLIRNNNVGGGSTTEPGTDENVWTEYREALSYTPASWFNGIRIRPGGPFLTSGDTAWSVWTGCYSEGNQGGSQFGYKAIVIGGDHGSGVYATNNVGTGQAAWLDVHNGEFTTGTNLRVKGLYLGQTRPRRSNDAVGMKMSAASTAPVAGGLYVSKPYMDHSWEAGDIVWNQARTGARAGVTPPLGWRCVGGPADFEEIPFPSGGGGSSADASSGNHVRSIRRTGSALPAGKALYVASEHGNHSWGQVAELAIENGKDRPSVGFYHAPDNFGFSVGMFEDNWFKIKKQSGPRFGGFGADYVVINPANGDFYTAAVPKQLSDARLKENVRSIEGALDKVCRMRGVTYTRRDTGDSSSGVIAQEMEEVAPELVSQVPDGTRAVAYGNTVGYLIEAIKELRAENAELRAMITTK